MVVDQRVVPASLAGWGCVVRSNSESFGGRKEFIVVASSFLVRCFVKHSLWEKSSRRGGEVKLAEACC